MWFYYSAPGLLFSSRESSEASSYFVVLCHLKKLKTRVIIFVKFGLNSTTCFKIFAPRQTFASKFQPGGIFVLFCLAKWPKVISLRKQGFIGMETLTILTRAAWIALAETVISMLSDLSSYFIYKHQLKWICLFPVKNKQTKTQQLGWRYLMCFLHWARRGRLGWQNGQGGAGKNFFHSGMFCTGVSEMRRKNIQLGSMKRDTACWGSEVIWEIVPWDKKEHVKNQAIRQTVQETIVL